MLIEVRFKFEEVKKYPRKVKQSKNFISTKTNLQLCREEYFVASGKVYFLPANRKKVPDFVIDYLKRRDYDSSDSQSSVPSLTNLTENTRRCSRELLKNNNEKFEAQHFFLPNKY